jgi:hypothetical protein
MKSRDFKELFGKIAIANGFKKAFGGWYKESTECLAVIALQKSNYGNYYQLNIKILIHGVFQDSYTPDRAMMITTGGHIGSSEPKEFRHIFDLDEQIDDKSRHEILKELFFSHIIPFTDSALSREGIKELVGTGVVYLLPSVKKELGWE